MCDKETSREPSTDRGREDDIRRSSNVDSNIDPELFLLILQLSDSAFPTGGFSHSLGYESAVRRRHVIDKASLEDFIICTLENVGSSSLPYVKASYLECGDVSRLRYLDEHFALTHSNHVTNRASKQQGRSLLHVSGQMFQQLQLLKDIQERVDSDEIEGFQEIVFGALYGALGIPLDQTLWTYLFGVLRTLTSSVVRLGRILQGSIEVQAFQFQFQRRIPNIIQRNYDRSVDEVCLLHPIPDLMQSTHDLLFSRMFYS